MLIGILCALSNILLLPHCPPWGIYVEVPGLFIKKIQRGGYLGLQAGEEPHASARVTFSLILC